MYAVSPYLYLSSVNPVSFFVIGIFYRLALVSNIVMGFFFAKSCENHGLSLYRNCITGVLPNYSLISSI